MGPGQLDIHMPRVKLDLFLIAYVKITEDEP